MVVLLVVLLVVVVADKCAQMWTRAEQRGAAAVRRGRGDGGGAEATRLGGRLGGSVRARRRQSASVRAGVHVRRFLLLSTDVRHEAVPTSRPLPWAQRHQTSRRLKGYYGDIYRKITAITTGNHYQDRL